ncbi:MAG: hypothetical protein ACLQAH_04960 [Limisphaerales bacterium]
MHSTPKNKNEEALTPEEVVALALNEQGYLFHHKIIQVLQPPSGIKDFKHDWIVEASEVPVSLPNGMETRIDLVLRHTPKKDNPWRVVVECKRADPRYKRWVFFGDSKFVEGPWPNSYFTEHAQLANGWNGEGDPNLSHYTERKEAHADCPVFDFGVEAMIERPGHNKRASATDSIEDAFQQVTLGLTGLGFQLKKAHATYLYLIPLVVTTAELMSVHFHADKVSLAGGMIDSGNLKLEPRKWLAVNYRISDVVSQFSGFTGNRTTSIAEHLVARQIRTVFVVQAENIQPFLEWLEKYFPCAPQR